MKHRMLSPRPADDHVEIPRTTIVGGRSTNTRHYPTGMPRGIEVLVKKAAVDAAFREVLIKTRSNAAATIDLQLDETEARIIDGVPESSLQVMVSKASVPTSQRKAFMGSAAGIMLAAIGALPSEVKGDETQALPRIVWQGVTDVQYEMYMSDDLDSWSYVGSFNGVDGEMSWIDQTAFQPDAPRRYYRVMRRLPLSKGNTVEPVPSTIELTNESTE